MSTDATDPMMADDLDAEAMPGDETLTLENILLRQQVRQLTAMIGEMQAEADQVAADMEATRAELDQATADIDELIAMLGLDGSAEGMDPEMGMGMDMDPAETTEA